MLKRVFGFFSGLKMTVAAGVFLAVSLILMFTKIAIPVDPAWVTVVICGFPLLYLAITRLAQQKWVSSALLISIAMIASIAIGELFAAGEVAFIMAIGAILEDKTIEKAKRGIKNLISLAPGHGRILRDEQEEMVPIEQVQKGDLLRILPGEAVPVDGEIVAGNTSLDQSIITGESLPVDKTIGDTVFCGTINRFGSIDVIATKVGENSSLQKLIRLVQDAENNKAPMQRMVDRWATWLVPIALAIAVVTYLFTWDITRAVTILVVFCPCALALATPTSIIAAIGQATKHGVIIKSGEALERMGKVDTIAFDKTGTLTHGSLTVSDVQSFDSTFTDSDIMALAASAEARSEHPLGKAVAAHAKELNLGLQESEDFFMIPGKGVSGRINGKQALCGNEAWLADNGIMQDGRSTASLERLRQQGKATILVTFDGQCKGVVALSDTLRDTAKGMVQALRLAHTDAVLLTGDNQQAAHHLARQVGIETVFADLLPTHKVERILALQAEGRHVCMIGDGVNDAPALKTSNVGVAMGGMGSDIAVEAADIALMGDDISKIPYLKRLSNATLKQIKLNIAMSMLINFAAVILSILALLNPVTGALVHNVGSVLVVLHAALLYDRKFI